MCSAAHISGLEVVLIRKGNIVELGCCMDH